MSMKYNRLIAFILFLAFHFPVLAQENEHHFANAIREFREIDKTNPPKPGSVLFIGSSSFTIWTDLEKYFPDIDIINRAFGGSTLSDQIYFAGDIIFPYLPRQIFIYCGENDLAFDDQLTTEEVFERFLTLYKIIRSELPNVPVLYVSMKPSPDRWHLAERFFEANRRIQRFIDEEQNLIYIDIWDSMLDSNGNPDPSLFLEDMLHMNEKGYDIWKKALEDKLIK